MEFRIVFEVPSYISLIADIASVVIGSVALLLAWFGLRTWVIQHRYSAFFSTYESLWTAFNKVNGPLQEIYKMMSELTRRISYSLSHQDSWKKSGELANDIGLKYLGQIEYKIEEFQREYEFAVSRAEALLKMDREELMAFHMQAFMAIVPLMDSVKTIAYLDNMPMIMISLGCLLEAYGDPSPRLEKVAQKAGLTLGIRKAEDNDSPEIEIAAIMDEKRAQFSTYLAEHNPVNRLNKLERLLFWRE